MKVLDNQPQINTLLKLVFTHLFPIKLNYWAQNTYLTYKDKELGKFGSFGCLSKTSPLDKQIRGPFCPMP